MSGLRYPGGKTRAVKILSNYIPKTCKNMVSIFLGGGSFEIYAASNGIKVVGYDILEPLILFWRYMLSNPDELKSFIQYKFPITKDNFIKYQNKLKYNQCSDIEKAGLFFILNRSSFSGTTMSGGFSKQAGSKRFTQSSIDKITNKSWFKNINVYLNDFEDVLDNLEISDETLIFADPPYVNAKKLYGVNGEGQNINHKNLMTKIKKFKKWLITYDDCELIRELYKENVIISTGWSYGMNSSKKSNEVIIISDDLLMDLWLDTNSNIELGNVVPF